MPILHGALTALPLVTIAAYCRYLDASWIFACVVLGAVFVDRVATMGRVERRRVMLVTSAIMAVLFGIAAVAAWPVLTELFASGSWQGRFAMLSLGAGAALPGLFLLTMGVRRPTGLFASLAVIEAVVWFMLPFASTPRFGGVDTRLIAFLRDHTHLQRFAIASGTGLGLGPNFGSVFGIPSMNYDDLPVPARTARFVTTRLDATNDGVIFGRNAPPSSEAERDATRSRFIAKIAGYAQAGVRYVLSVDQFNAEPAYPLASDRSVPVGLKAGQTADIDIATVASARSVGAVSLLIGTYRGAADGALRVSLCQAARCLAGAAPLVDALDDRGLLVALDSPLMIDPGGTLRLSITKEGGLHDVALWMRPATRSGVSLGGVAASADYLPVVEWVETSNPLPVVNTLSTTVYELTNPRPYATAPGCRVDTLSHDLIETDCPAPSQLLRLKVFMNGWVARMNGVDMPVTPIEDTFQAVPVPAGHSVVKFIYAPRGLRPSFPVALGTLALCLIVLCRPSGRAKVP